MKSSSSLLRIYELYFHKKCKEFFKHEYASYLNINMLSKYLTISSSPNTSIKEFAGIDPQIDMFIEKLHSCSDSITQIHQIDHLFNEFMICQEALSTSIIFTKKFICTFCEVVFLHLAQHGSLEMWMYFTRTLFDVCGFKFINNILLYTICKRNQSSFLEHLLRLANSVFDAENGFDYFELLESFKACGKYGSIECLELLMQHLNRQQFRREENLSSGYYDALLSQALINDQTNILYYAQKRYIPISTKGLLVLVQFNDFERLNKVINQDIIANPEMIWYFINACIKHKSYECLDVLYENYVECKGPMINFYKTFLQSCKTTIKIPLVDALCGSFIHLRDYFYLCFTFTNNVNKQYQREYRHFVKH